MGEKGETVPRTAAGANRTRAGSGSTEEINDGGAVQCCRATGKRFTVIAVQPRTTLCGAIVFFFFFFCRGRDDNIFTIRGYIRRFSFFLSPFYNILEYTYVHVPRAEGNGENRVQLKSATCKCDLKPLCVAFDLPSVFKGVNLFFFFFLFVCDGATQYEL
jgi:hypothetical protein